MSSEANLEASPPVRIRAVVLCAVLCAAFGRRAAALLMALPTPQPPHWRNP